MNRKKWITVLLCICMVIKIPSIKAYAGEAPMLHAAYAAVTDATTGRVLYMKEGFEQVAMASTTKILTCIIALEKADLNDIVTVSSYAQNMPQVRMGIREGEQYRLGDLLYALMLESYNDVAVAVAEHVGGTVEGFAALMNDKAADLCDRQYYFITPNGLDATATVKGKNIDHSISAANLSRIMNYCCFQSPQKEQFLKITRTQACQISSIASENHSERTFSLSNHNRMLSDERVVSGKTGYTGKAGYCYVAGVTVDGHDLGISLLACGWPNHKTYKWSDMQALLSYLEEELCTMTVSAKEVTLSSVKCNNLQHIIGVNDGIEENIEVELKNADFSQSFTALKSEKSMYCMNIQKEVEAPLQKGCVIGSVDWYIGETKVADIPVIIAKDYQSNTYKNCLIHTFNIFLTICINSHRKY